MVQILNLNEWASLQGIRPNPDLRWFANGTLRVPFEWPGRPDARA